MILSFIEWKVNASESQKQVKELKWKYFKFIYTLYTYTYNDMSKKEYIFIYTNQYEALTHRLIKTSLYLQETWFALKSLK